MDNVYKTSSWCWEVPLRWLQVYFYVGYSDYGTIETIYIAHTRAPSEIHWTDGQCFRSFLLIDCFSVLLENSLKNAIFVLRGIHSKLFGNFCKNKKQHALQLKRKLSGERGGKVKICKHWKCSQWKNEWVIVCVLLCHDSSVNTVKSYKCWLADWLLL